MRHSSTVLVAILCAMFAIRSLASSSPLVSLLCTDELLCSEMVGLGGTRPILSVSISVDAPFASAANVTVLNPALPLSSKQFDAVVLTILTSSSTSTTAVFLAILAAEAKAEATLGRNSSAWLVAADLLPAVDLAASNLDKPFLAVPFTAVGGVASSLPERLASVISSSNFLGTVSYDLGSTAYLTGAIAAELSVTGSLALITGPYREPSVSFHAYVRAVLHRRCPTCVLMATYQPPIRMSSAAALLDYSRIALPRAVDVIIVEMPIEPFREFKRLLSAEPRFAKATLLCVACSGGLLNTTFLDAPIHTALTASKQRRSSSQLVNSSIALFHGRGLSVSVCLACLPIRAQRAFADEFAHVQTLYELNGQQGVEYLLDLPLIPSPLDPPLATTAWMYSWTDDPSVVAVPNANGTNDISVTPVTAVASNCGLFRVESTVDCALLSFSPQVRNVTTLNVVLAEWTSQSISFVPDSSVTSWLNAEFKFPDGEFSVDAVGSAGFLLFGGYQATRTAVPLPLDDLFLLIPQGDQPAAVTTVVVHRIAKGADSSSSVAWPSARSNHAHVAVGSGNDVVLYIHGGRGTGGVIYSDLWSFHLLTQKWTQLPSSGEPRYGHTMMWMPRFSDPVLVIVGGNNLFAISSVIHYSVNRSLWFPSVELAVASTSCAVPLDAIHIAFLNRNFESCVLDILSLQVACQSRETGSTTASLNGVSTISGVFCEGVHALSTRKTTVGVAVIPKTALSTASMWLEVFSVPTCPLTRLSNASESEDTLHHLYNSEQNIVNAEVCDGYCAEKQFPYGGTCVPCSLDASSAWSWTNISLTADAFLQAAAAVHPACNVPAGATDSSGTIAFSVVLVVVFFVGGSVLGYVVWNNVFDSGDDRNCAKAPAVIPLTLVFVDIHLSASCWIRESRNHAKFVDLFAHSVREATIREGAYKIRNVGDGVLLTCQNAVDGLRLLQTIRSLMRRSLKHYFLSGGCIELPAWDCLLSDDDGSPTIRGVRVVPEMEHRQEHIDAHLNRIKFAFHTTACVDIRRTPTTVHYEGEETLFPVFASHQTRAGEVAFTLDTVAELQESQRNAIADGAHLRKGKKDSQIRQSTLNNIVHLLGDFDHGDVVVISPVTAAPPVFVDRCPDPKRIRERICNRGLHIRTVKSALLDTNKIQTTGEGEATPAESPFPSLVHTKYNRQRNSLQRQSSSTPSSTLRGSNPPCPTTAVLAAGSLMEYLDDTDLINHHVTAEEFEAMTHLIATSLYGVLSTLTREDLSALLKRIDLSFALGRSSFLMRPLDVCSASSEAVSGQTMETLQLIAARVLQMMKPATAKHQLKRCAKAGKRAADMGVAEASETY